ncbi:MAG TPA: response regulator transcription factor [Methylomirabilota bacterium]|nr:response regulator transcription factor [Methylomirabilota bacterium]
MRVLIADDHPLFRAGLKETLAKESDVDFVGEADNGHKALELARKQRWDVVVLDITMPGKGGEEVLQELRRERPKLPILVLSAHPEDQLALRLLKAGAAGYLTKDQAPKVLLAAIRKILRGGKYISESLAEKAVQQMSSGTAKALHESLSDREYQIMRMIASGKTIEEIGKELFLSVSTVRTYRARVFEKMNMKSATELVRYALENKLID